jgi:photosystem II stability/assembly factor-like uncharacterized protein
MNALLGSLLIVAAVVVGVDKETVLREWGQPSGQLKDSKSETLLYSRGREVTLVDGKVVAVKDAPAPTPPSPRRTAAVRRPVAMLSFPLHEAAARGRTNDIAEVLAKGVDINDRAPNGDTALHWIARVAPIDSRLNIAFLLQKGADINATNRWGRTPLHEAVIESHMYVIELLLKGGANINATDNYQRTPLQLAVIARKKGAENHLRVAGADATIKDRFGLTAADIARDQEQWVLHEVADYYLKDATFGNNLFVAVGGKLWTSLDGATWKSRPTPHDRFCGISFVNGEFFATGEDGIIQRSADALTWSAYISKHRIFNPCRQVCRAGNLWLAADQEVNVRLSTDGMNWDYGTPPAGPGRICGVAVVNGEFVIVNDKGASASSRDGRTWKRLAAPRAEPFLVRMRRLNDEFFAVGYKGVIVRSRDGVNWTTIETEVERNLTDIAYGNGQYVAVGTGGTLLISTDGQRWAWRTLCDTHSNYTDLTGVCYGQNVFIAVGRDAIWSNHVP